MPYLYAAAVLCSLGGGLAVVLLIADRWGVLRAPCRVRINEGARDFTVTGGQTLLEALYERDVFIPSACGGQGTCGHCKVRVLAGGGPVLATERAYLAPDEIATQTRLACQVKLRGDVEIHLRPDYLQVRQFRARVVAADLLTHDTRQLGVELIEPQAMAFEPGQYVQIRVPHPEGDVWRAYSISSEPANERRIELIVRLIPGGAGSTYLHRVEVGDELLLTGPYGEFAISDEQDVEIVCVAGGCGAAPVKSIVQTIHRRWPGRRCWVFLGMRTRRDVLLREFFDDLQQRQPALRVFYALSEPTDGNGDGTCDTEVGFIHETLDRHLPPGPRRQAFLCGPEAMIASSVAVLEGKGTGRDRIFFDTF